MVKKIINNAENISFQLKEDHDFKWLERFGQVFRVFDKQESGNISFGVMKDGEKYFLKYAGANTMEFQGDTKDAVNSLEKSAKVYEDIKHRNLIKMMCHGEIGDGYAVVFDWVEGECLNAHWDFDKYPKYSHPQSPNVRFFNLSLKDKLSAILTILDVQRVVNQAGYVAVDFYDGSLMYDFNKGYITVCDIDFYQKMPLVNYMGRMWGSSRFMSPEEYEKGAVLDEITNVYTMGAMMFELLGSIVIGNPLTSSLDFPPLHTVHETFTSHGVPSGITTGITKRF